MADDEAGMTARRRLEGLAAWVPRLEHPSFSAGSWEPTREDANGVLQLGYFVDSPAVEAFRADLGRLGWVQPFDWMAWLGTPEGRRLADDQAALAEASADDLQHLLTAIVRSDRFSEGSLAGAFESGLVLAICRRAATLASDPARD